MSRRNPAQLAGDTTAVTTRDELSRDDAGDRVTASSIGGPRSSRLDTLLNDLRSLAAGPSPAPSAELHAMLDGAAPPVIPAAPRPRRHGKTIAGALIMGSIGAGLSGAAAARERPAGPVHRIHSHVVPETTPTQGEPVGAPAQAPQLPEPRRPRLIPARPVPHVATPTSAPTLAPRPTPRPTPSRTGDPDTNDQVTEHDHTPGPGDGTDHEREHEHETPGGSG